MAENLEIKIKVSTFNDLLNKLEQIGAEYKGQLIQKDIYYKANKRLIKLRIQNTGNELIRYNRNEEGANRFCSYDVLHLKNDNAEDFFNGIFTTECVISKKRELWIYENTRIHLDTVKELGKFMELETLVLFGKRDAKERFNKLIYLLELDYDNQIRASYRDLILKGKKSSR